MRTTNQSAAIRGAFLVVLAGLLVPTAAWAHSPIEGVEGFYAGVLHPLLVPAHALCLTALGLWLGRQDTAVAFRAHIAFLAVAPLALAATLWTGDLPSASALLLGGSVGLGLLSAAAPHLSSPLASPLSLSLACAVAIGTGIDSASGASTPYDRGLALAGTWLGMGLILLCTAALSAQAQKEWHIIGVRVVGSWIAASALMVLALTMTA